MYRCLCSPWLDGPVFWSDMGTARPEAPGRAWAATLTRGTARAWSGVWRRSGRGLLTPIFWPANHNTLTSSSAQPTHPATPLSLAQSLPRRRRHTAARPCLSQRLTSSQRRCHASRFSHTVLCLASPSVAPLLPSPSGRRRPPSSRERPLSSCGHVQLPLPHLLRCPAMAGRRSSAAATSSSSPEARASAASSNTSTATTTSHGCLFPTCACSARRHTVLLAWPHGPRAVP